MGPPGSVARGSREGANGPAVVAAVPKTALEYGKALVFQVPPDIKGTFGALMILASIIGAVGGSAANLLPVPLLHGKKMRSRQLRRLRVLY